MTWGWVFTAFRWLLGLFGGDKSRIKFDMRSESSIEKERKELDRMVARIRGLDNELQETTLKLVSAKRDRDMPRCDDLDAKREWLLSERRRAIRDYDDAERRIRESR